MQSAISPDIWDTKRLLITKLYQDEEWPLKQVIKLVQTPDFHPSESQLRSRLKKWHITKPSRKKYDGRRRLSGAKKNSEQKRLSESQPCAFQSTPPRPISSRKAEEPDLAFSDVRSECSRPSMSHLSHPELSASPVNHSILPPSPVHSDLSHLVTTSPFSGLNLVTAPSTPITPAFDGAEESTRAPKHSGHPVYFCSSELSPLEFPVTHGIPTHSSPCPHFGSFDPRPLSLVDQSQVDYVGYRGVHYTPSVQPYSPDGKEMPNKGPFLMPDLSYTLIDGPPMSLQAFHPQPPHEVYPHSFFAYEKEDCIRPLALPIDQNM